MSDANLTNFHYAYMDLIRHWDADSEKYTGGDALFTAMSNGWKLDETVRYQDCWLTGGRYIAVYYFDLKRGNESITMPVLINPHVGRLIASSEIKLVSAGEKKIEPAVKR